jgi:hypothetical protein
MKDFRHILVDDTMECWNTRVKNPRSSADYSINHALHHRIDAMVLVLSKATDMSKILGIDYDELERLDDEPSKSSASIAMCEEIPSIVGVARSGKNYLAENLRHAYVKGIDRAVNAVDTLLTDKNVIADYDYVNCPCMKCELTRQWVELKRVLRDL